VCVQGCIRMRRGELRVAREHDRRQPLRLHLLADIADGGSEEHRVRSPEEEATANLGGAGDLRRPRADAPAVTVWDDRWQRGRTAASVLPPMPGSALRVVLAREEEERESAHAL